MSAFTQKARGEIRRKRVRRFLRAMLLGALATLVLFGGAWLLFRNKLGLLAASEVRHQAALNLNGRLDFSSVQVDLLGRALFKDLAVYDAQGEKVIAAPAALAAVDPFTLVGPNRGARSLALTLLNPVVVLRRSADGGFNLAKLTRPHKPTTGGWGYAVAIRGAAVHYTDEALLAPTYPQWQVRGLTRSLFDELGYNSVKAAPQPAYSETLGVNGNFNYNGSREELSLSATIERPGASELSARGGATRRGRSYSFNFGVRKTELAALGGYLHSLFPKLVLTPSGSLPTDAVPAASAVVDRATVTLSKPDSGQIAFGMDASLSDARYRSKLLPELQFPRLRITYSGPKALLGTDFVLHAAGLRADGNPQFDFRRDRLAGRLTLDAEDFAALYKSIRSKGPQIAGKLRADLRLSGHLWPPDLAGKVDGTGLAVKGSRLGNLVLAGSYSPTAGWDVKQFRLNGGALPLSGSGRYSPASGDGAAKVSASGVQLGAALELVRALGYKSPAQLANAGGALTVEANLAFRKKHLSGNLALRSEHVGIGKESFDKLTLQAALDHSVLKVQQAKATVQTGSTLALLGFSSTGPLRATVGVSGTATLAPKGKSTLDLSGSVGTLNLGPQQALLDFSLAGPLRAPRFDAKLRTTGTTPLSLIARGTWGATAPLKATLEWAGQRASFDGAANLAALTVNGKLTASDLDLAKLSQSDTLAGKLSLDASISGPLGKPSVTGKLSAPNLSYVIGGRKLAVSSAQLAFKLANAETLSVSSGSFTFAGSPFTVSGTLGRSGQQLTLRSNSFALRGALAALTDKPPLDITAAGPLSAVIRGTLKDPQVELSYASGPGTLEGNAFDNAQLNLTASLERVHLAQLGLSSAHGSMSASGDAYLRHGAGFSHITLSNYEFSGKVNSLDVSLLTPLTHLATLKQLSGALNGDVTLSGSGAGLQTGESLAGLKTSPTYNLAGAIALSGGRFGEVPLDSAKVAFATRGKQIELTEAYLTSGAAKLTATGTIGPKPGDLNIHAGAQALDLALLKPLLPSRYKELSGPVSFDATVAPPETPGGYPRMELALNDTGSGIVFSGVRFSSVSVSASLREGLLLVNEAKFVSHGSALTLAGKLSPELVGATARRPTSATGGRRYRVNAPLDFSVTTSNFQLGVVRALLPPELRASLPGGTVSADLTLGGRLSDPQLSGNLDFNITQLPASMPVAVSGITGRIAFDRNRFDFQNVKLAGSAGKTQVSSIGLAGSGRVTLRPFGLVTGAITLDLSPGGVFTNVSSSWFKGTLGGQVVIQPQAKRTPNQPAGFAIGGNLIVNASAAQTSTLSLHLPSSSSSSAAPNIRFDNFTVQVQPGTQATFRAPLIELLASLQGSVTLDGVFGENGPGGLEANGRLDITKGELSVYRHTVRLNGAENYLDFSGLPGDYFPYFTGGAQLLLRHVLRGDETIDYASGAAPLQPGQTDLTINFSFNHMHLGPSMGGEDEQALLAGGGVSGMAITSEPPLPEDQLRSYLLGDVYGLFTGQTQLGQFAQSEILAYSTSFVSKQIERGLGLSNFTFGGVGSELNPFYLNLEKELVPDLYIAYYRTFYTSTNQQNEVSLRYRFFHAGLLGGSQNASAQVAFKQSGLQENAVEVELKYNVRFGGGKQLKAAKAAAKQAAAAGQPLSQAQKAELRQPDAPPAKPPSKEVTPADAAKAAQKAGASTGAPVVTQSSDVIEVQPGPPPPPPAAAPKQQ